MKVVGGDPEARGAAAAAENRILDQFGLRQVPLIGPDQSKWRVVLSDFAARADEVLGPDGHTLTASGIAHVEHLVRGTLSAASSWLLPRSGEESIPLEILVDPASPASGPSLKESLETGSPPQGSVAGQTARPRVEIHGSRQGGFATNPTVKAFWNGQPVGELKSLGGHLTFDIASGGELRLKSGLRSATVQVGSLGGHVHLGWDRMWGRLIAGSEPYAGA
jgi:hypothetical protein